MTPYIKFDFSPPKSGSDDRDVISLISNSESPDVFALLVDEINLSIISAATGVNALIIEDDVIFTGTDAETMNITEGFTIAEGGLRI